MVRARAKGEVEARQIIRGVPLPTAQIPGVTHSFICPELRNAQSEKRSGRKNEAAAEEEVSRRKTRLDTQGSFIHSLAAGIFSAE